MNKISKKYKLHKLKQSNLYKNKKKTRKNIVYNLSGGKIKDARVPFFSHFETIKPYLLKEKVILQGITPSELNNKLNITATKKNSKGMNHPDTSYINVLFENIIKKITEITHDFFKKNDNDINKDYDTYEEGDILNTFCNKFIDNNIEWIINCYINNNFKLNDDDNLLFNNYTLFLKLYTQLKFLVNNSDLLLDIIKRQKDLIKDRKKIKNNNNSLTENQKENIIKLNTKYNIIRDNIKKHMSGYYILGNVNNPYFESLLHLQNFLSEYEKEIIDIKEIIINKKIKKEGEGPNNVDILVDTPNLYVYEIKTKAGSLYYGSNTKWCTAAKTRENMYDSYSNKGPLYIIQAKDDNFIVNSDKKFTLQNSNNKYQIQLESNSLMNNEDKPISLSNLFETFSNDEELINFIQTICKKQNHKEDIYQYSTYNNVLSLYIKYNSLCFYKLNIENKNITHLSFSPQYNQKLDDSLNGLKKLTHLSFSEQYNQKLDDSLNGLKKLTHLSFSGKFNQPLGNSLDNLTNLQELSFKDDFDKPFDDSLDYLINLQILTISGKFNQPFGNSLNNLTKLKSLMIGGRHGTLQLFNQPLENSLDNLKELTTLEIYNGIYNQPFLTSLDNLVNLKSISVANISKFNDNEFFDKLKKRDIIF